MTASRLRISSWVLGAASIVLPAAFVAERLRDFEAFARSQGGYGCGMPVLAIYAFGLLLAAVLSLGAVTTGFVEARRSQAWRGARIAEIVGLALPLLACLAALVASARWLF